MDFNKRIIYVFSVAGLVLVAACGGGGGAGTSTPPLIARAEAPAYDVIAEVKSGSTNSIVTFRKLDGTVIATHKVCAFLPVDANAATTVSATTTDGYVRVRCPSTAESKLALVIEFNPGNWAAPPIAVNDDAFAVQAFPAIISYGPNGLEFYNKNGPSTNYILFRVSGSLGQRIAQDIFTLPTFMQPEKLIYSDDRKTAYLLATERLSYTGDAVFEIDLATFTTKKIVAEASLINDIAINGTDLVYSRSPNTGQPSGNMIVVNAASKQVTRRFKFDCPSDRNFNSRQDFGGKIVLTNDSLIVGAGRCYPIFNRVDYSLTYWNFPTISQDVFNIVYIPQTFDGKFLWSTYQLGTTQAIVAYDPSTWLVDSTPKVFVPATGGQIVRMVH